MISPTDRASFLSNEQGMSLVELIVALAAGTILLAGALDAFNIVQTFTVTQQRTITQQQDLRLGLEVLEQDVRMATASSIVTAAPDRFSFSANINAQYTTTTGAVLPGQSVLAVQDGSEWSEGKTVVLCARQVCETHRLSREGQRYQLTLNGPVASSFPAGTSVSVSNRVVYYTKQDAWGTVGLMRMVDGGANTIVGALSGVQLSYRNRHNRRTSMPSEVQRVVVEIEPSRVGRRVVREVSLRS